MSSINFDNPYLLLILVPLLAIVIISFIIAIKKENRTINNIVSFIIHIVIVVMLTLTVAKTTLQTVITETNIYVLADVSFSSHRNLDLIDDYIEELKQNVPRNSKIGVICFGKDYELLVELGDDLISVKDANVDDSETDIVSAINYATTLFEEDVIRRLVIISDGEETNKSNISTLVQSLSNDNVYIDAIFLDNNIKENINEVQINSVEFTPATYINNQEQVHIYLQSNTNNRTIIKLYCNDVLYKEDAISLNNGYNTISFDLNTEVEGIHNYKVVLESDMDEISENNSYLFSQEVAGKTEVLFISSLKSDEIVAKELYGDSANITYMINKSEVPYSVEDLCKYDEFVLSNIDIRTIYNYSQFVNSLDVLVSSFGKSLITIGNTYIQNNEDDETLDSLNNMLPVKFGNKDDDSKLVTIVIDISRSMEQIDKLNIAKEVACSVIDNLDDEVKIMLIGFFGEVGTIFTPEPASNRDELKDKIRKLEAYQGTFLGSALAYTYEFVTNLHYDKNEVLLISDGLPYGGNEGTQQIQAKNYVERMALANISVSTVNTVSKDGLKLMEELASIGNGYSYNINDLKEVESLVLNEVMNSLKDEILEDNPSKVDIILKQNDLVLGIETLPDVIGIIYNTSKVGSDVVINATYTDSSNRKYEIPLYATWDYGNGRVSSFTSNISGDWISNWIENSDAYEILSRFVAVNQPSKRSNSAFITTHELNGTIAKVSVNAPTVNKKSIVMLKATYPDGTIIEKEMTFDSENYVTSIPANQLGKINIELSYTLGELSYTTNYSVDISYLPEYNQFTLYEASNLYYMVTTNGKVSEDGKLVVENDDSIILEYILDFTPLFMTLSIILFVVDVMVRKLRLEDLKALVKFFKRDKSFQQGGSENE